MITYQILSLLIEATDTIIVTDLWAPLNPNLNMFILDKQAAGLGMASLTQAQISELELPESRQKA